MKRKVMSSIYQYYICQIAPNHYHLCKLSKESSIDEYGERVFTGTIYCATTTSIRIIDNDYFSEKEVSEIITESKEIDDMFEPLLASNIREIFRNVKRILSLISDDIIGECLLSITKTSNQSDGLYNLISFSNAGLETKVKIGSSAKEISVSTKSCDIKAIEKRKNELNIEPYMKCNRFSKNEFDVIHAYIVSSLTQIVELLRYKVRFEMIQ